MVVLARLTSFATTQSHLRAAGQAGFVPGRSAADHLFVMRHLIDRARLGAARPAAGAGPAPPGAGAAAQPAGRAPLFAAFMDLEKAYDSVPRLPLMRLLAEAGLHGSMLQTLYSMYWRRRRSVTGF
jgi:hypothetical protein